MTLQRLGSRGQPRGERSGEWGRSICAYTLTVVASNIDVVNGGPAQDITV